MHSSQIVEAHRAIVFRFDARLLKRLARRSADVECPHRQLRSRFADGLRGDDTHRFAEIDRRAASEIAAVALAAHAVHHLASEHRTDADLLYACLADGLDLRLFDQGAALDQHGIAGRILDVLRGGAPEDAAAERSHHLAGIDDGPHLDARLGLAVLPGDDAVLGDVDQPPGQIPGVGGLERGVGQAFARAVGGVEVLQDREALLEIGDDRALDDLARGLRHQAAHAGELAHLRRRAARAGMRHHVDRVDVGIRALGGLLGRGDFLHHLLGDFFGRLRPGVDHLVVLLAVGDQAVIVLLLEILRQRTGGVDDLPF